MAIESMEDAFAHGMEDLLSAEKQLTKALPKMAKAASDPQLREMFEAHLEETKNQVTRLEQAFEAMGRRAKAPKCKGMAGLIEEGQEVMEMDAPEGVLDAMLIAAAQKVEHYEIASYGTLCTWGEQLGLDQAVRLLKQNLSEEKKTDEKLTQVAEQHINVEAEESADVDE